MNADGSGAVNLTPTPGVTEFTPSFSPDGRRVAYTHRMTDTDVFVTAADAVTPVNLTSALTNMANAPDWEPIFRCAKGKATIVGSDSPETLKGTKRADIIVGNGGNDKILGRGGRDRLCGGLGKDRLRGGQVPTGSTARAARTTWAAAREDKLVGGKGKDKQVQ